MHFISLSVLTMLVANVQNSQDIRHDIIQSSGIEKDQFLNALYKMKSIPSKYDAQYSSYDYYTYVYIQQGITKTIGLDFLTWNRGFLYQFEQELQIALDDPSFRLLYWDLTNQLSTSLCLYDESFVGGNGSYINSSSSLSCSKWQIDLRLTAETKLKNYTCLLRNIGVNHTFDKLPNTEFWVDILSKDYNIYQRNWKDTANAIKQYIGGHEATIAAPVDPIFWFIRAWIDAIWTLYQDEHGTYYNYPENANLNKSVFENEYFIGSSLSWYDVMDTDSLQYSYSLEFPLLTIKDDEEWWKSKLLWAFIFAAGGFMLCALFCVVWIKCHRKRRERRRTYSSDYSLERLVM